MLAEPPSVKAEGVREGRKRKAKGRRFPSPFQVCKASVCMSETMRLRC